MGIHDEWDDFEKDIPEHAPAREVDIMRRGFYLGAHAAFVALAETGALDAPNPAAQQFIDDLDAHLLAARAIRKCSGLP